MSFYKAANNFIYKRREEGGPMSLSPICGLLRLSQLIKRNFGQFLEMRFLLGLIHPCRGLVIGIDTKTPFKFLFILEHE